VVSWIRCFEKEIEMSHRWMIVVLSGILFFSAPVGCGGGGGGGTTTPGADTTVPDVPTGQDASETDVAGGGGGQLIVALDGGTVEGPDGVVLEIPGGALAEDTAVWIEASDATLEFDGIPVGDVYRFHPTGLNFQFPVTLTVPYDADKVSGGVADLRIWWADDEGGPFEALPGWVDPEAATVTSEITHFSVGVVATFLDPSGEAWVEWTEHWRPDDVKLDESHRFGAVQTADGGFVLTARGLDLQFDASFWVTAKYSKGGQLLWTDVMPAAELPAYFDDVIVRETPDGDILLCASDIRLTRLLDANGAAKADFSEAEHDAQFYATDCWPRAEGGVLFVGEGTDNDSASKGLLFKALNAGGVELWDVVPAALKNLYPSDARMTVGTDGRIYAAASHHADGGMDSKIIVGSVDGNGLADWGQVWTSELPRNRFADMELAGDILYVAGLTHSGEGAQHDAVALLAFKEGALLWSETRNGGGSHRYVGSATVFSTGQGHPLLAAHSNSDLGPGMGRIHLWKFTPAGQESFDFESIGPGYIGANHPSGGGVSAATDPSAAAYLTVAFHGSGENATYRTIKVDSTGAFEWAVETGTPMPTRWAGAHRTFTLDGGVFIASVAHDDGAIGYDNDGRFYMIRYGQK
jgi:hypothetical protein